MTATDLFDHDPFVVAVVLAIATGLLSVEDPELGALTLTLAALAVTTRLVRLRSPGRSATSVRSEGAAISIVALAALAFLLIPTPWGVVRGPVLSASLLPLWWASRYEGRGHGATA